MPIAGKCLARLYALKHEVGKVRCGRQCHFIDAVDISDDAAPAWVPGIREDERTLDAV